MNFLWMVAWLLVLNLFLVAAEDCTLYSDTDCSNCTKKDDCYWCESSKECTDWKWGDIPECKDQNYYFRQCNVNGFSFILIFSLALLLILFTLVCCCVCCCCYCIRRRRRREYSLLESRRASFQERQRQFQARRDEIRHKYGLDSSDATV